MSQSSKSVSSSKPKPKASILDPSKNAPNIATSARERNRSTISMERATNDDETVFFETVTMSKFEIFQKRIFPIVTAIIAQDEFKDHPFANLWQQAATKPDLFINGESTLRMKLLPVENLQDYRRFIMEYPSIEHYITFQDSTLTTSGFDIYFKEDSIQSLQTLSTNNKKGDDTEISSFELLANQDPSKTDTDTLTDQEPFNECFGNKKDFQHLWTQVSFILNTFALEHPNNVITTNWRAWQLKGLTIRSDFQQVKLFMGIPSLADLYLFLHDCQPINEFLEVKWDGKILYGQRPEPISMPQTTAYDSHKTIDDKPTDLEEKQYTTASPNKAQRTDVDSTEKSINDRPHSPFVDMFHDAKDNPTLDILDYYTVDENQVITSDNFKILHSYITDRLVVVPTRTALLADCTEVVMTKRSNGG